MFDPFLAASIAGLTNDPIKIKQSIKKLKLYLKNNPLSGYRFDEAVGMINNLTKLLKLIKNER